MVEVLWVIVRVCLSMVVRECIYLIIGLLVVLEGSGSGFIVNEFYKFYGVCLF